MARINLSPPWITYYRQLDAFFAEDPEVKVIFDDEDTDDANIYSISLYVDNAAKAEALDKFLPKEKEFGNIIVNIYVISTNAKPDVLNFGFGNTNNAILQALANNHAVRNVEVTQDLIGNPMVFIIFKRVVVSYFTDNLTDYYGVYSTLYQDLAKEIFGTVDGVFFCTDVKGKYSDFAF